EFGRAHFVPPLQVLGLPALERPTDLGIVGEADVVGDATIEVHGGGHQSQAARRSAADKAHRFRVLTRRSWRTRAAVFAGDRDLAGPAAGRRYLGRSPACTLPTCGPTSS